MPLCTILTAWPAPEGRSADRPARRCSRKPAAAGIVLDPGGNRGDYLFGGPELSNVISKPGFYISRLVKTALKVFSPFITSAGVIALGCVVSAARRVCDCT